MRSHSQGPGLRTGTYLLVTPNSTHHRCLELSDEEHVCGLGRLPELKAQLHTSQPCNLLQAASPIQASVSIAEKIATGSPGPHRAFPSSILYAQMSEFSGSAIPLPKPSGLSTVPGVALLPHSRSRAPQSFMVSYLLHQLGPQATFQNTTGFL